MEKLNLGTQSDHDLLVRISTLVEVMAQDIKKINEVNGVFDSRIRILEDNMCKLMPIPSVSHEELVKQVNSLTLKMGKFDINKGEIMGGWKLITIIAGIIIGIANFILIITNTFKLLR